MIRWLLFRYRRYQVRREQATYSRTQALRAIAGETDPRLVRFTQRLAADRQRTRV